MWKTFIMQILVILILSKNISIMQNLYSLWEKIILVVAKDIPKAKILTWFRNSAILACDEKRLLSVFLESFTSLFMKKIHENVLKKHFDKNFLGLKK